MNIGTTPPLLDVVVTLLDMEVELEVGDDDDEELEDLERRKILARPSTRLLTEYISGQGERRASLEFEMPDEGPATDASL